MKKADYEKEQLFVHHYTMTGNASESCVLAGYKKTNSAQMGYYLKSKLKNEIKTRQAEVLTDLSGKSISVLQNLLDTGSSNVQFNTAKLILELSGFTKQTDINLTMNNSNDKTDKELTDELDILLKGFNPSDMPKTSKQWDKWHEDNPSPHAEEELKLKKKH
tara:strand:- start:366 stop:851 length:486 start_codon:yes stop_codon:yes gene_type:complete